MHNLGLLPLAVLGASLGLLTLNERMCSASSYAGQTCAASYLGVEVNVFNDTAPGRSSVGSSVGSGGNSSRSGGGSSRSRSGSGSSARGLEWYHSFCLAAALCGALIVSHTVTVSYVAWRDLTGQWDKYALIHRDESVTKADVAQMYWRGYRKFVWDITVMLLPALTLICRLRYAAVMVGMARDPWWLGLLKQTVGYHMGELWVAAAHKMMHHPRIFKIVHQRHHCPVPELVASVAWLDTTAEFMMGEVPALSMALNVLPTHPCWHILFFAYQGLASAADHAGFCFDDEEGLGFVEGWVHYFHQNWLDGEFHYYHHLNPSVNFAEEEWIDHLFGTHHTVSVWWKRREARREKKELQQQALAAGERTRES
tara:strand:+ start:81 stop:1187 length:1107 start_codon:yes stop_codon:yes gene_type:complete